MGIKKDICAEYLEKFPNTKTKTLAIIIYDNNKEAFKDVESVRGILRYYRGNKGDNTRKYATHKKENETSGDPFKLPDSEADDWLPVDIPIGNNRILLLSDVHVPYHDVKALELAIAYGKKKKVNTVIFNGDTIDFYQGSSFMRDPRKKQIFEELETTRQLLDYIYHELGKPKIYFKLGNHEERYERYLFVKAPELLGIEEFKLNILLQLGKYGAEFIDKKRIIKVGKLNILHGHEFGRSVFSPVNPARGVYMRAKENSIIGHHHQSSEHTEPTLNGKVITAWSTGCLCELHPEYMPINKWNHGFAYISSQDREFNVRNKRIYNGVIL